MSNDNPKKPEIGVTEVLADAEQFVWAATEEVRSAASHLVKSTDETDRYVLVQLEESFHTLEAVLHSLRSARTRASASKVLVRPRYAEQIDKLREVRTANAAQVPEGA